MLLNAVSKAGRSISLDLETSWIWEPEAMICNTVYDYTLFFFPQEN